MYAVYIGHKHKYYFLLYSIFLHVRVRLYTRHVTCFREARAMNVEDDFNFILELPY